MTAKTWMIVKTFVPNKSITYNLNSKISTNDQWFFSLKLEISHMSKQTASTSQKNTVKCLFETKLQADGIVFRFIRDRLPVMPGYLTVVINISLVISDFLSLWQHGIITPILKSGDTDEGHNYRPINILLQCPIDIISRDRRPMIQNTTWSQK